jgi:glycosyltransferase involved in cell wall biosynthesis
VIATSGGARPEVGAAGYPGVIGPPGDERAIVDAIAALLADPEARSRMGAAGRKRVLERFTWEHNARSLDALYRDVLARRV